MAATQQQQQVQKAPIPYNRFIQSLENSIKGLDFVRLKMPAPLRASVDRFHQVSDWLREHSEAYTGRAVGDGAAAAGAAQMTGAGKSGGRGTQKKGAVSATRNRQQSGKSGKQSGKNPAA